MRQRAIVFTRPGIVEFHTNGPLPPDPAPHEVLCRNRYSIVSAGTELACLDGLESWLPLPGTPGYACCAEILALGSPHPDLAPGQLVLTYGPHAEYFKIDLTDRYHGICVPPPPGLAPAHVPFTRLASIAMAGLRASTIELGDWVLVTGLGQIGNFVAQEASLQGARVIGVDLAPHRLDIARACGLTHLFSAADPSWKAQLRALTGGQGVSTFIDASGLSSVVTGALDTVAHEGEVILLGSPRAPFSANLTDVYRQIHLPPFLTFKGALEFRFPTFPEPFVKHSIARNSTLIMELFLQKKLLLEPLFSHLLHPSEAPRAYAGLRHQPGEFVGVVFDWTA